MCANHEVNNMKIIKRKKKVFCVYVFLCMCGNIKIVWLFFERLIEICVLRIIIRLNWIWIGLFFNRGNKVIIKRNL